MVALINLVGQLITIYMVLMFIRIVGSWFPNIENQPIMRLIASVVDPYLNLFRSLIPPIGGVLDLSPILAYFGLQIIQSVIVLLISQFA